MSMPLTIFYCTKCDFDHSFSYGGTLRYYKLPDGDKIYAPQAAGWCTKCNTIEVVVLGQSSFILNTQVNNLRKRLAKINKGISDFQYIPKFVEEEINDITRNLDEKQKLLSVLNGKTSVHKCTKCGSIEVNPYHFSPEGVSWPDATSYAHIGCGGQIKKKYLDIRFSFVSKDIFIEPEFVDYSNKPQEESITISYYYSNNATFRSIDEVPIELNSIWQKLLSYEEQVPVSNDRKFELYEQAKSLYYQKYPKDKLDL